MSTGEPATKKLKTEALPEHLSGIPEETKKVLIEIDTVQNEIDSLNEKASEEILKVEQKYNLLRRPQYEKRCEMIKKIPNFWCTAFLNHPQLSSIIDESEEQVLAHLSNIEKGDSSSPLSFFEWLSENVDPAHDDIAEVIKDDMWPNPLQYYLLPEMEETGDDFEELIEDEEGLEEVGVPLFSLEI
ncbi:unnamed protein product [Angiostrongylus costaricensis]|uniref:Protein SET n=1 Tax=Angiostrongylus costaricensis TaxID=334426 RepID=A0A0R3PT80_ANGCS|nr:unnamed protein product [Angiostrongylus costaricensis]